jgi:hypothetical protein
MKTVIDNASKYSKLLLKDDDLLIVSENSIEIEGTIITDMNSGNSTVIENIEAPDDWEGFKYCYDNGFVLATDYRLGLEKLAILKDLYKLREEISLIITQIRLLHDPEPDMLTQLTPTIRDLYLFAKDEISVLTPDNVSGYILRGPQVQQLLFTLNSLL